MLPAGKKRISTPASELTAGRVCAEMPDAVVLSSLIAVGPSFDSDEKADAYALRYAYASAPLKDGLATADGTRSATGASVSPMLFDMQSITRSRSSALSARAERWP